MCQKLTETKLILCGIIVEFVNFPVINTVAVDLSNYSFIIIIIIWFGDTVTVSHLT